MRNTSLVRKPKSIILRAVLCVFDFFYAFVPQYLHLISTLFIIGLSLQSSGEFVCVSSSGIHETTFGSSKGAKEFDSLQPPSDCVFIVGRREVTFSANKMSH
jgi:hypothetical protein